MHATARESTLGEDVSVVNWDGRSVRCPTIDDNAGAAPIGKSGQNGIFHQVEGRYAVLLEHHFRQFLPLGSRVPLDCENRTG